jgi:hypothetical protein
MTPLGILRCRSCRSPDQPIRPIVNLLYCKGFIAFALFLAGAMVLATTTLHAQDEGRLRKALEGKRITLKMDMPATADGVDVYPGSGRPVDYDKVGKRMKKEGVAMATAPSVMAWGPC